ncbi:MAG: hypothetical protein DHS20C14_06820 [Phycisphaeraceae bacterium]|nr:MAG: hypothetical protein DHS20C14_06820 [Phycisphaeraceae bacterium]
MLDGWWIADLWAGPRGKVFVVSWIVWVVGSIVLHELAHGWAALSRGDQTPRVTGHMTWNPVVHMGQMSLIVFLLVGVAWGAMPVSPSRMRGRWGPTIVSAAGPAMNLAIAVIAMLLAVLWLGLAGGAPEPLRTNVHIFLSLGAMLNLVLMALNLLPIPPLDGGRIAMDISHAYRRMLTTEHAQWVAIGAFLLLLYAGGRFIFGFGQTVSQFVIFELGERLGDATGMGIPRGVELPI